MERLLLTIRRIWLHWLGSRGPCTRSKKFVDLDTQDLDILLTGNLCKRSVGRDQYGSDNLPHSHSSHSEHHEINLVSCVAWLPAFHNRDFTETPFALYHDQVTPYSEEDEDVEDEADTDGQVFLTGGEREKAEQWVCALGSIRERSAVVCRSTWSNTLRQQWESERQGYKGHTRNHQGQSTKASEVSE